VFRRSDRRDGAPDEAALAARNAATQGFLALDDEQRAAAAAVDAAQEMGTAGRLGRAWAEVAAVGDRATEAYLTATSDFPVVDGLPSPGGRAADERALREIERAREVIRRFRESHARVLDEAAFALTSLPRTVQEARTALTAARSAVQQADASGMRSRRAAEQLAEAEQAAAGLEDTAAGLRERRVSAQRTLDLARSAAALAAEAPRTAQTVRSALASIATRRSAAATKTARIEPAMSALRREFSEPCSRDLLGAERSAADALADADRAIAAAQAGAAGGDWDGAAEQITAARSALSRAEAQHEAVTDRLDELREVRADPSRQAADTRFVLRDAQRLVVDRGLTAEFAPVLDAQAVRLQNAQDRLSGVHPDYWLYLTELRGIRDRVRDVVADARRR
jgi:chromosome segregation ATPase